MFKNVAKFLNSTGKGVNEMKKIIAILPIVLVAGAVVATSAFAISDNVTVSASISQATTVSIAIKDAETGGADLAAIDFGTVPNEATDHRKKQDAPAGGAWVDYFVGAGTHELRVWFDNFPTLVSDPSKAIAGLKATVGGIDYYWPLKIWTANLGPAGAIEGPDPEVDTNWTGDATARYMWIFEKAYKVNGFGNTGLPADYPAGIYKDETRSKLSWYYPTGTAKRPTPTAPAGVLDARLRSRYRVDLAIDALDAQYAGTTATNYSGTLVFDLTQAP